MLGQIFWIYSQIATMVSYPQYNQAIDKCINNDIELIFSK